MRGPLTECPYCNNIQRTTLSSHLRYCKRKPKNLLQLPKDYFDTSKLDPAQRKLLRDNPNEINQPQ